MFNNAGRLKVNMGNIFFKVNFLNVNIRRGHNSSFWNYTTFYIRRYPKNAQLSRESLSSLPYIFKDEFKIYLMCSPAGLWHPALADNRKLSPSFSTYFQLILGRDSVLHRHFQGEHPCITFFQGGGDFVQTKLTGQ